MFDSPMLSYLNMFWFAVFPYLALMVFFLLTIQRYTIREFTFSSLSSQFLENKHHFWGMVPFHYGIITILAGHVVGFLIPRQVLLWNSNPLRLYVLELTAFVGAVFALVGLVNLFIRRVTNAKAFITTTTADWIVLVFLFFQILTGIYVAIFHSWGSTWFASSLSPYLWSIVWLSPDISYVTALPFGAKLHIVGAFALILLFPFTRLVHILVVPNPYLWRKPQIARWNYDRKTIRTTGFKVPTRK